MSLHERLLAAHRDGDQDALVTLYAEAAEVAEDEDARAFFLTHAYVFALATGSEAAAQLHRQLVDMGREE